MEKRMDGAVMAQGNPIKEAVGTDRTAPPSSPIMTARAAITVEELHKARQTLLKYRAGKAQLENRVISAEQWWKLRHWQEMGTGNQNAQQPASAWLFNVIMGKHADAIEAFPEPNILPREAADEAEARKLTSLIPVILEQNGFEETYSDCAWQKMKTGTAVYGVYWDGSLLSGLGDISIRRVDLLNLFWEPGISDIQNSRHLFHTAMMDDELLQERYPQLRGKTLGKSLTVSKFRTDDLVDTSKKSVVVDWYYKKASPSGKTILHYCKFVGNEILFASENEMQYAQSGWYADGQYPFVLDRLFPVEGSPCGYGYIDVCKGPQECIDQLGQAVQINATMSATPRYFVRSDGAINEEEFMDWHKPLVHVNGNLGQDSLRPVEVNEISGNIMTALNNKIEEMKTTSGNMDVQNGGTSGVTAASAIAAMQEAAGRTSKASTKSSYRAYGRLITMVIERIRQFYDVPRTFRILGQNGAAEYVSYTNAGMKPQAQMNQFGVEAGMRLPVFDIKVAPQKMNAYSKVAQNELALQLYQAGIFNPQMADQAMMLLDMMDFDGKHELLQKVQQNGTMLQQLALYQQMALTLAARYEPQLAEGLAAQIAGGGMPGGATAAAGLNTSVLQSDPVTGFKGKEHALVENARKRSSEAGQPG